MQYLVKEIVMSNQKGAISNDALAVLVVVAIVLTVGSFGLSAGLFGGGVPITGYASTTGTATATVSATTVLTFTVSTVAFGTLDLGNQSDTSDGTPAPFTLQNDGSVDANITISSTNLFSTKPTSDNSNDGYLAFYSFNATWDEAGTTGSTAFPSNNSASFINVNSSATGGWRSMPGAARWMANCTDFSITSDALDIHINVTVPADEPSGAKSATVTVVSTQSATGANC